MRRLRVSGWWFVVVVCVVAVAAGQKVPKLTHTVVIHGFAYAPAEVAANVGDTIVWTNKDIVAHTVTAEDGSFDSGKIAPGATWQLVAKRRGTHAYRCTPHPNMHGTLVVQ